MNTIHNSTPYDAIENLVDEKAKEKNWKDRDRIGLKKNV
jgi:hypothetical protein